MLGELRLCPKYARTTVIHVTFMSITTMTLYKLSRSRQALLQYSVSVALPQFPIYSQVLCNAMGSGQHMLVIDKRPRPTVHVARSQQYRLPRIRVVLRLTGTGGWCSGNRWEPHSTVVGAAVTAQDQTVRAARLCGDGEQGIGRRRGG